MSIWLQDNHQRWVRRRIFVVAAAFLLALGAVLARVYYLQVVVSEDLERRAIRVDREFTFEPRRGSILDRNGVELAVTVKAPSIFAQPRVMKDIEAAIPKLASVLDMKTELLTKRLNPKRSFVWLRRQVTPAMADAIRDLKIKGVGIRGEHKRFYPQNDLAGQLVGFVGIDGNGLEGVERVLESKLAGGQTQVAGQRDVRGRMLLSGESPKFDQLEGHTVQLTIDERIQRVAQNALQTQVDAYNAKGGYAIVIDIPTGEVLALANTPNFDPNHIKGHTPKDWRLATVTDTFEPGSVVKPLLLAAALEEGTVTLDTPFDCEKGRIQIGRYSIRDSHAHDTLSAAQIVQVSSNIGAYKIAQTLGRETYYKYLRAYGFGSRTGLGAPGEQPGLVWPSQRWAEVSFANVAFGQGFSSTPVQVASAVAAIGNGGLLLKPRLVHAILDKEGNVVEQAAPTLVRRIVRPEVARQTAWAMSLVTTRDGTAPKAAMKHYTVAGKTGTAQKVNPKTRRYDPNMWVASFVGFFPAERPRVAIAVMVDEPHKSHYGGTVAAPAFKAIAKTAASVLNILPVPASERFDLGVEERAPKAPPKPAPKPDEVLTLEPERLPVLEASHNGALVMPDLRGQTLRDSLLRLRKLGVMPEARGWGRVVSQRPEPGEPWSPETPVTLELSPATRRSLTAQEPSQGGGR